MINITRKEDCCGCEACRQACPKQCIEIKADEQGFVYPIVDASICIDCHLCERVCPTINQAMHRTPQATFAATNIDSETKYRSSSGGVFFALAKSVIEQGGVVFGVKFDENWQVVHSWADTLDGVKVFQGSKYVQSRIGDSFTQVQRFLNEGRKVMFTGTPCQIAGLRLFLRKDYGEQLLLVDVACHGTPSPLVWNEYLKHQANGRNITGISFRDKRNGWVKYGMCITYQDHDEFFQPMSQNLYMQGFLHDIYLRPSCFKCPSKAGKSGSDITLADFWGIQQHYPELYAKGYYSLVLANTQLGNQILRLLSKVEFCKTDFYLAIKNNPALVHSVMRPKLATYFWNIFASRKIEAIQLSLNKLKPSFFVRIIRKIKRRIL